jgi:hypothetical protein
MLPGVEKAGSDPEDDPVGRPRAPGAGRRHLVGRIEPFAGPPAGLVGFRVCATLYSSAPRRIRLATVK